MARIMRSLTSAGDSAAMWPGITRGWDARCTCTWAHGPTGWYEVKVRDFMCRTHGGPLDAALARIARST